MGMALKERIKEILDAGFTSADLARAAGKTPASVTFWLSGATKSIKGDSAAGLEALTGYSASWIATGKGEKKVADREMAETPLTLQGLPLVKVKLVRLEKAGMYQEVLNDPDVAATEFAGVDTGPRAFAVQVTTSAAAPVIPMGSTVIVDPDEAPKADDWLVVQQDGHVVIKMLMQDGADKYLVVPDSGIKPKHLDDVEVIGVVMALTVRPRGRGVSFT